MRYENKFWKLINVNELPKDKNGNIKYNNDIIGFVLKYKYKPRGDIYDIKILDCIKTNGNKKIKVEYIFLNESIIKTIRSDNLINNASISNIIPSTNKWRKRDDYWIGIDLHNNEFKFSCKNKDKENVILHNTWYKSSNGYISSKIENTVKSLHRIIVDCPKGKVIDHINNNRMDNREENLRIATNKENNRNRKTKGKFKYVGIQKARDGWCCRFGVDGKTICTHVRHNLLDAEIDCLISQEYLGLKHNEDDFKRIKNLPKERILEVTNLLDEKLERQRNNIKEDKINSYKFEDYGYYIKVFIKSSDFIIDKDDVSKFGGYLEENSIFLKGSFGFTNTHYILYNRKINRKCKNILIHRYILGLEEREIDFQVDHLNQNSLDNRKSNLEIVTRKSNLFNKSGNGYNYIRSRNKYQVNYAYNYKYFEEFIGGLRTPYFDTEEEAKKEAVRRKEIMDELRVRLKNKEELEELKQYAKDNGFEDYDEAYLYWKGYLK